MEIAKKIPADSTLLKVIQARCKQCNTENDKELCKGCIIKRCSSPKTAMLRYCKECRNGNPLEFCGCEDECPLYKYMPLLLQEQSNKIHGVKS